MMDISSVFFFSSIDNSLRQLTPEIIVTIQIGKGIQNIINVKNRSTIHFDKNMITRVSIYMERTKRRIFWPINRKPSGWKQSIYYFQMSDKLTWKVISYIFFLCSAIITILHRFFSNYILEIWEERKTISLSNSEENFQFVLSFKWWTSYATLYLSIGIFGSEKKGQYRTHLNIMYNAFVKKFPINICIWRRTERKWEKIGTESIVK